MKKTLIIIAVLFSLKTTAQTDTGSSPITVVLPVKAVVIYSFYLSQQSNWTDRKAPEQISALIGSGNNPDSLVTITVTANKMVSFSIQLQAERYGALNALNKSILNNSPVIAGYTPLTTQITVKASGQTSQSAAAQYVINKYNQYLQTMTELYGQMYQTGLNWIRN